MLLNKKIIILGISFLLLVSTVSAEVCEIGRIKQVLKKILFLYYTEPSSVPLTKDEVKDMLVFYLSISSQNLTVDCSVFGSRSNKPISDVVNAGENVADKIPTCADGTKYGECSKTRPAYCYAGAIYQKCGLCGCPANSVCGKSQKCEATLQNITCFKDIDCGQASFSGSYYCTSNYIIRNYLNYSCINPGTSSSRCDLTNGTLWLSYCNPSLSQICVDGKSTCESSINNSAPTVSISVNPTTVAQGQFFNVTVVGTDDVGLAAIWWWATNSSDSELNKAHWYSCNGARACTYSWLVSTNATGTLTLGANSRDTAYPVAGQPHQASEGAGIAYATLTVASWASNATRGIVTVKGRLIDYFTKQPIANGLIYTWDSQTARRDTYTNANGEFSATADTTLVSTTSPKSFGIEPKCYDNMGMGLFRNSDNSLYVNVQINSLIGSAKSFAVSGSEVNVGDIPMWPAVDIQINSDIAVKFNLEYSSLTGSGNSLYKTLHYLSYSFPLTIDTRAKLTDQANNIYYSPYLNVPLSNGCAPVNLNFFNKQFSWNSSITQANATSNCFVKIDGVVVNSVYATDRNDCYSKTSFGSINCRTYTSYFTNGTHFLEQYFGANDRVNNEYCTCASGVCVQGNQTSSTTNQTTSKPDLIVFDITFSPTNPTTADYTNVYLIIKNIGTTTAWNFSTKVDYVGGQSFLFGTGTLPPGATTQPGQLGNYWPAGTNTFIATVDANSNIVELNESNNALTKSLTVTSYSNQTGLGGFGAGCTSGAQCSSGYCVSTPLDNTIGNCTYYGGDRSVNYTTCTQGYYPTLPCQCGGVAIHAGACNNGIFYWPPTQSGNNVGAYCTDGTQCKTGICFLNLCSYTIKCTSQSPGYCYTQSECTAVGANWCQNTGCTAGTC